MTHDYKRNGTTTLFAALEDLQGKVIGHATSAITIKHEQVRNWLKRHPRFVLHFLPTSFQLAESGRALVRPLPQGMEQGPEAVRVDRDGTVHHGETLAGAQETAGG